MKKSIFLLAVSIMLLGGCTQQSAHKYSVPPSDGLKTVHIDSIELRVPTELKVRPSADEHRVIDNDSNDNDIDRPNEYRIEIFPANFLNLSEPPHCSSALTGVYPTKELAKTGGKTTWGSMDRWTMAEVLPEMICKPTPPDGNCKDIDGNNQPCPDERGVHALCSEKNGKTVVICISQMKDDPELAKKIFETFRWTK